MTTCAVLSNASARLAADTARSFRAMADAIERNGDALDAKCGVDITVGPVDACVSRVDKLEKLVKRLRHRADVLDQSAARKAFLATACEQVVSLRDPEDPAFHSRDTDTPWHLPLPGIVRLEGHGSPSGLHDTRKGSHLGYWRQRFGYTSEQQVDMLAAVPGFDGSQFVMYDSCYSGMRGQALADAIRARYGAGTGFVFTQSTGKNTMGMPYSHFFVGRSPEAIEAEVRESMIYP